MPRFEKNKKQQQLIPKVLFSLWQSTSASSALGFQSSSTQVKASVKSYKDGAVLLFHKLLPQSLRQSLSSNHVVRLNPDAKKEDKSVTTQLEPFKVGFLIRNALLKKKQKQTNKQQQLNIKI